MQRERAPTNRSAFWQKHDVSSVRHKIWSRVYNVTRFIGRLVLQLKYLINTVQWVTKVAV